MHRNIDISVDVKSHYVKMNDSSATMETFSLFKGLLLHLVEHVILIYAHVMYMEVYCISCT